jgi:hypothetical protein
MNWHLLLFQVILLDTQVHLAEQTNVNKRLSEYKNQIMMQKKSAVNECCLNSWLILWFYISIVAIYIRIYRRNNRYDYHSDHNIVMQQSVLYRSTKPKSNEALRSIHPKTRQGLLDQNHFETFRQFKCLRILSYSSWKDSADVWVLSETYRQKDNQHHRLSVFFFFYAMPPHLQPSDGAFNQASARTHFNTPVDRN